MTDPLSDADLADHLGRRRARMLPVLGLFFLIQQSAYFSNPPQERVVDYVRIGAWMAMSLVILFAVLTGGFWFRKPEVRAMVNDEVTRANRGRAMEAGFLAAMIAGIALYPFKGVLELTAGEAIHLIVSAGILAMLMRFAVLERRAYG